jgi:hypothetical protein
MTKVRCCQAADIRAIMEMKNQGLQQGYQGFPDGALAPAQIDRGGRSGSYFFFSM